MRPRLAWLLLACGIATAQPAVDSPGGALEIGELTGAGWAARGIALTWRWGEAGAARLDVALAELELEEVGRFRDLRLACETLTQDAAGLHCTRAEVDLLTASGERLQGTLGFDYTPSRNELGIDLRRLEVCSGRLQGRGRSAPSGWRLALQATGLDAACLVALADVDSPVTISAGALEGELDAAAGDGAIALELDLSVMGLAFGNASGSLAGEALDGRVAATLRSAGSGWAGMLELGATQGVVFDDPVLLDAALAPLALRADLEIDGDGRVDVSDFVFDQGEALDLSGWFALAGDPPRLAAADLAFASHALDGFYTAWLQPLLIGTALDDLALDGVVRGRLQGAPEAWEVEAELEDVAVRDRTGRFAFGGLTGRLHWGGAEAPPSELRWAGGRWLGLAVGASRARFTLRDGTLELLEPLRQPLVDGALAVHRLEATGVGSDDLRVVLEAELEPISLEALGYAFDWPRMAGRVGGAVPKLTWQDAALAVDGELRVDLFDGAVRIRDLRLERPLGPLAALHADVAVENLDLELLTRTFTIGRIEGRFGGRIDGLLLHDWRPVRFDAELGTPPGDTSRHRISQRAVDNITRIGGLGGVLSQGALRFFEEFGYSRLGFRCRLRGAVCELDGVEPAGEGYYLVKGGGLPRINIIGHVRRVDWAELVTRVQRAMAAPDPVVK